MSAQASLRVAHSAVMAATREVQRYYEDHPRVLSNANREHLGRLLLDVETMLNTAIMVARSTAPKDGKEE